MSSYAFAAEVLPEDLADNTEDVMQDDIWDIETETSYVYEEEFSSISEEESTLEEITEETTAEETTAEEPAETENQEEEIFEQESKESEEPEVTETAANESAASEEGTKQQEELAEEETSEEETSEEESSEEETSSEDDVKDIENLEDDYSSTISVSSESSDQLLDEYFEVQMQSDGSDGSESEIYSSNYDNLSGTAQVIYKYVRKYAKKIAAGNRASTTFKIYPSDLGVSGKFYGKDLGIGTYTSTTAMSSKISSSHCLANTAITKYKSDMAVYDAILDNPYDFYWSEDIGTMTYKFSVNYTVSYDSSKGQAYAQINYITMGIPVGRDYAGSSYSKNSCFTVDTSKASSAITAANNAKSIVSNASGLSDYSKLYYYAERIVQLVEYDYYNASWNYNSDAHQLIHVFDNDSSTNVVCEGYAKAFQYLCDLTTFTDSNIWCYSVAGDVSWSGGDKGGHMWNIVHYSNGNYLVDVTNCDEGSSFSTRLFMILPSSGSVSAGYRFDNYIYGKYAVYYYDRTDIEFYRDDELTLGSNVGCAHVLVKHAKTAATATTKGNTLYYSCKRCGCYYSDSAATKQIEKGSWVIPSGTTLKSIKAKTEGITISWAKAQGYDSYCVYRREAGSSSWKKIKSGLTGTSYTDTRAKAGTTYYYTVRAYNAVSGKYGSYNTTGLKAKILAAPTITVTSKTSGIKIAWTKVSGASIYRVYRKTANGSWKVIAKTTSRSYFDSSAVKGQVYYYKVRAYDNGAYSSVKKGMTIGTVTLKSATPNTTGITIKWSSLKGASSYKIYRRESGSSSWKLLKSGYTKTSYKDTTAKGGVTYFYTVKAYNKTYDVYGSYNTTGIKARILAAPTVTVKSSASYIKVSWSKVAGAEKYLVYRAAQGDTEWTLLDSNVTARSYTDTTADNGVLYYYRVRAYSSSANYGKYCTKVKGIRLGTKAAPTYKVSTGKITLKWKQTTSAQGYYVYRRIKGGEWRLIKTITSGSTLTYTDTTMKAGKYYAYKIIPYTKVTGTLVKGAGKATSAIKAK